MLAQIDKAKALGERERLALLHADNEDKHGSGNDYKANKASSVRCQLRTARTENSRGAGGRGGSYSFFECARRDQTDGLRGVSASAGSPTKAAHFEEGGQGA